MHLVVGSLHKKPISLILFLASFLLQSIQFWVERKRFHFEVQFEVHFEAHVEALKTLDPNPVETLRRLKDVYPFRFECIVKEVKEWRIEFGLESEELTTAYNNSKTRGEDFY